MVLSAAIVTGVNIPVIIFYRDKPPSPPSYTASVKREEF